MTPLERLARAVILYHDPLWDLSKRTEWVMLTGTEQATTRTLCDLARRLLLDEQEKGDAGG